MTNHITKYDWSDLRELYIDRKLSTDDVAKVKGGQCNSGTVYKALKTHGIPIRNHSEAANLVTIMNKRRSYKGSGSPRWKGGRKQNKDGYVFIFMPEHPFADKSGYVREHRLVMEKKLGRYLAPWEIVHHKEAPKHNNAETNLELKSSQVEHLTTIIPLQKFHILQREVRELKKQNRLLKWQVKEIQSQIQGTFLIQEPNG